jgi:hypothetical protein
MDTYCHKTRRDIEKEINYLTDPDTTFDLLKYYNPILYLIPKYSKGVKSLTTKQYDGLEALKRLNPQYIENAKYAILNEYVNLLESVNILEAEYFQLAKDHLKNNGTSTKNSEGTAD